MCGYRGLTWFFAESTAQREWVANVERFIAEHGHDFVAQPVPASAPLNVSFNCKVSKSPVTPASVNFLRPSDIDVVAAIGDSITAGFGAQSTSLLNLAGEWRGLSWSIGGQEAFDSVQTVPNLLKFFNPDVYGFSTGKGQPTSDVAVLNRAVSGAIAQDLPAQVDELVAMLKADPNIDFLESWKLITVWIGRGPSTLSCTHAPQAVTTCAACATAIRRTSRRRTRRTSTRRSQSL